jgi:hypothetical protein
VSPLLVYMFKFANLAKSYIFAFSRQMVGWASSTPGAFPRRPIRSAGREPAVLLYSARLFACSSPFLMLLSALCDLIAQATPASAQASR